MTKALTWNSTEPQPSPFTDAGAPSIDRLSVPVRWLGGERVEGAVAAEPTDGSGFAFAVGKHRFHYDRLGLRRAESNGLTRPTCTALAIESAIPHLTTAPTLPV